MHILLPENSSVCGYRFFALFCLLILFFFFFFWASAKMSVRQEVCGIAESKGEVKGRRFILWAGSACGANLRKAYRIIAEEGGPVKPAPTPWKLTTSSFRCLSILQKGLWETEGIRKTLSSWRDFKLGPDFDEFQEDKDNRPSKTFCTMSKQSSTSGGLSA